LRVCSINLVPTNVLALDNISGLEGIDKTCCWSYFSL